MGGAAGPLAQTVVAPDAATEGVLSVEDARILCICLLAFDPDRSPHIVKTTFRFSKGKGDGGVPV